MFKKFTSLPPEVQKKHAELLEELDYYTSLPKTITNLKKEFNALFKYKKFINTYSPLEKMGSEKEVYRMQIINTHFSKLEDSDEYLTDTEYAKPFEELLDLLKESKEYGKEMHFWVWYN